MDCIKPYTNNLEGFEYDPEQDAIWRQGQDDEVNHPSRYFHNGIETIDVIEAWTSELTGVEAFCIGNAIKYLSRWKDKGGKEDLRKAVWYIQRVIDGE